MKSRIKVEVFENYMKRNRLSKTAFSKLCGLSPKTMNKILNGDERLKSIMSLIKISEATGIEMKDMFIQ